MLARLARTSYEHRRRVVAVRSETSASLSAFLFSATVDLHQMRDDPQLPLQLVGVFELD